MIQSTRPLSGSLRELCTRFERASCGGPQADGLEQSIEVGCDALVETIEPMALLLGKAAVGRNRSQETSRERRVHALEELQKQETDRIAVWQESIAA